MVNLNKILSTALFASLLVSISAHAHHSPNVHFDREDIVEISGLLTSIQWQNPHTQLTVATATEDGSEIVWLVEGRGASQFARAGVTPDFFQIGTTVQIAGFRGRRNPTAMFATNILLADGPELVVDNFVTPRWSAESALMMSAIKQNIAPVNSSTEGDGIFRIWSPDRSDHGIDSTGRTLWADSYPLTESAQITQSNWDPIADNPYIDCQNGMPAIMDLGTPMEFVRDGDDIVLNLEEQDAIRRIRMKSEAANDQNNDHTATPYGHSVGYWEGTTLVVTTIDIEWPWFDQSGIPQSSDLTLVEHFMPSTDGLILRYRVTATDPNVFTQPVVLERAWVWDASEKMLPYNCIWDRDDL